MPTKFILLVLLLAFFLTQSLLAETSHFVELGPYEISDLNVSLHDEARDRRLETRLTFPAGEGPFPLVIISHGLGGNKESHRSLGVHLASHGYIVFTPGHPFSNTMRTREVRKAHKSGSLAKRAQKILHSVGLDSRAVLGRPKDVSFLIDMAQRWNQTKRHALYSKVDLESIAVAGHSFGAYTVYSSCGARPILDHLEPAVSPGKGLAPSLRDPRVDVGVAYSPQGPGNGFFSKESYSEMTTPMLIFSGSRDKAANFLGGAALPAKNRYRSFELMPEGDKYYVWLWNAGHMAWADFKGSSNLIQGSMKLTVPENEDVLRLSNALTLVFLDFYLKNDAKARKLLNEEYAKTLTGRVVRRLNWAEK